ncbi:hypothetical protein WBJ53_32930 (plasmid) [Spirosoma sp. SC4-14]|uniref:hypothetical protein n=1 Tax=Spirosoma sp. SC4-14 TaxID=3128900 RepID=UPI0030D53970
MKVNKLTASPIPDKPVRLFGLTVLAGLWKEWLSLAFGYGLIYMLFQWFVEDLFGLSQLLLHWQQLYQCR